MIFKSFQQDHFLWTLNNWIENCSVFHYWIIYLLLQKKSHISVCLELSRNYFIVRNCKFWDFMFPKILHGWFPLCYFIIKFCKKKSSMQKLYIYIENLYVWCNFIIIITKSRYKLLKLILMTKICCIRQSRRKL